MLLQYCYILLYYNKKKSKVKASTRRINCGCDGTLCRRFYIATVTKYYAKDAVPDENIIHPP